MEGNYPEMTARVERRTGLLNRVGAAWWLRCSVGMKNWAGNATYSTDRVLAPRSVAEAQGMVAQSDTVKPLGTRHSFSRVADTSGVLLSTEHLNRIVELGERTVVVEAGIRYGELGHFSRNTGWRSELRVAASHLSRWSDRHGNSWLGRSQPVACVLGCGT